MNPQSAPVVSEKDLPLAFTTELEAEGKKKWYKKLCDYCGKLGHLEYKYFTLLVGP